MPAVLATLLRITEIVDPKAVTILHKQIEVMTIGEALIFSARERGADLFGFQHSLGPSGVAVHPESRRL